MGVQQVEARRRAPVPEQARLDVLWSQRLAEQRVAEEIDLADREVVRRAPIRVDQLKVVSGERRHPAVSVAQAPA
jgi:hypothetical protein